MGRVRLHGEYTGMIWSRLYLVGTLQKRGVTWISDGILVVLLKVDGWE